jgi:hypothetical protein
MTAQTEADMEAIAQREKRYIDQESRLKVLEQGRVPGQVLDSGAGRPAGAGGITGDNIDQLHLQGKVTDATYRRFLSTGQIS